MTKREEMMRIDSTLARTKLEEPVFILAGRDMLAPTIVDAWADLAEMSGVSPEKVAEARGQARTMAKWQAENFSKVPD